MQEIDSLSRTNHPTPPSDAALLELTNGELGQIDGGHAALIYIAVMAGVSAYMAWKANNP